MNMIKRFSQSSLLLALLLCISPAFADDLQDASKLFKQGQNEQALEKVDAILVAQPKDAQARFLKGLILTEQGKTAEAIKVFTALTEDYPELPEPYNNIAVLYAGQGQYEKAKTALEMAIRTHPSYATAHENLGDIYAKMASQAYDRALQLDKGNTSTQTKLEMIKDLFGNGRKAVSHNVAAAKPITVATIPAAEPNQAASKPSVAVTTPAKPSANASADILKAVHEWAAAWSAKNTKKYLSFYAKEFNAPDGLSRNAWEEQRKARIAAPKSIHVEVNDAKVKLVDATHAIVSFRQTYRASHLHTTSSKTLELLFSDGAWLISAERSGK